MRIYSFMPDPLILCECLFLYHTIPSFNDPTTETFENILENGENAGNHHFLLFLQDFIPCQVQRSSFFSTSYLPSANAFNLDGSRPTFYYGKGLIFIYSTM